MFLIRQAKPEDTATLLVLARMVYFINLAPDEKIIGGKIGHSRECFRKAMGLGPRDEESGGHQPSGGAVSGYVATQVASDFFMFTMEDADSGAPIGTSQVRAHMGGPGNPNYSFKVLHREFRSESLGFGTSHLVARLHRDESGPSEAGGLILQPSFRGHALKPGRFLSLVRFHFIGLHREMFAQRVIAEMMGPTSSDGDNLFWDHIGRKFIPVKYGEADRFCQHNRRFIDELLPKDDLYLTLLPLEVLNSVAQVGPETAPARRLLERVGFKYKNFIDPFDGGPHLEAATDEISVVRNTRSAAAGEALPEGKATHRGFVSTLQGDGQFRAVDTEFALDGRGHVRLSGRALELLHAKPGTAVGYTPLEKVGGKDRGAAKTVDGKSAKKSRAAGKKKVKA